MESREEERANKMKGRAERKLKELQAAQKEKSGS
jgi:hypothetical protein